MLPNWEDRPEITAHLMNPAFCSEIIRECVIAYKGEVGTNFPYSLSILVLPLILNARIIERLPKNKSNTIHNWINKNEDLKINLAYNIKSLIPFSNEAIMFAIAHNSLGIDNDGNIYSISKRGKPKDGEIIKCYEKAKVLGKVLAHSGSPLTIYSILGIKP